MVYIFIFTYTQNALETMHSLPQLELWNVHLSGGFYSDTLGYVADGCKKCPNGSYVAYDKKPGKSVLDCKTCPDGSNQTCAFWRHQRVLSYKCVYTLSNTVLKLGKNEEKWFELEQPYLSVETNLALRQESNVAIPFPVLASLCMVGLMIFFFFQFKGAIWRPKVYRWTYQLIFPSINICKNIGSQSPGENPFHPALINNTKTRFKTLSLLFFFNDNWIW